MSVKEDLKKEFEIGKIKEGKPTFGQILGAGLFAAVARKNPGMAQGALKYQEDADEYNKYIEEKKEKERARFQKLIESRRNTLLGLLPSMKFGEALTPEYQAEINEIMSNYGEEDGKLLLEAYKVNPASASEFYGKLKDQQAELGGRISGVELGSLLKASIVPGKAAKWQNMNEALNFALSVNVGDTADYTRGLYELTQGGATAGGVSFDASAIANQYKPEAINLQTKMIDNEVIKQTRLQIADPSFSASRASDLESYLKDYAEGGKEQLYSEFGGAAILELVQNTQGFGSAALRYNPIAQNLWNQAGYAIPRGDVYFENVKRLKAELSNPNSNLNKDKLIERFEQDYGPGSAARAGVF